MKQKSAKDIAFEKERIKYRQHIRELEKQINENNLHISSLEKTISMKNEDIRVLNEWNDRLLEYTEMTKEDLQTMINHDKSVNEITDQLKTLNILAMEHGGLNYFR